MTKLPLFRKTLMIFMIATQPVGAGVDVFKRYYRDTDTQSVRIKPNLILGTLREGKRHLSERQAVEMALANSFDVNLERHASLKSLWDLELQKSYYDPAGAFGFNWTRATTPAASILQGGESLTDILTSYDFGYRQAFSTGTSFEVGFLGNRNRTTNFFSSLIPAIQTEFSVLFRQDLLQGFGTTPAEYQIEIGRNNIDITEQEFKRQVTDLIAQVQQSFWDLESSLKDIEVKEKALELAQTAHEQNRARLEVGSASRLEVVQTEAEVALREEELIRSKGTYRRLQDYLIRLITNSPDPRSLGEDIVPDAPVDVDALQVQAFERLSAIAAEQRPELQQAELNIANLEVNRDFTRDQLKPTLQAVGGYQFYGLGGTQVIRDFSQGFLNPPIVAVIPGGLTDSISQLLSGDFQGYVVGLNLDLPILNTDAKARNAQAQIDLRRARMERKRLEQQINLEIRDAMTQIEMNRARLQSARSAVRAAMERLDGEEARFEVGVATTRELLEAQRDLLLAALVQVRARRDLILGFSQLDKATGLTFDRFNLKLSEVIHANVD